MKYLNITFLIGNGFDIGMGMKSRFKDFFPIYQFLSQDKKPEIKQLADEIGGDYETWADFESKLGEYTLEFTPKTKQNFINQVKDFEQEFIMYLTDQETTLCFDDAERISNMMKEALSNFYLNDNLARESENKIKDLFSAHFLDEHIYNFINYNYTSVLSDALNTIPQTIVRKRKTVRGDRNDKIGRIVNVHGKCNSNPIIGLNDVGQIANKDLAKDERFTRLILKPSLTQLLRQGNDTEATLLIKKSTIICVYGMSLGATDKKWWDLILSWLSGSAERQLILFDYDEKYTANTQFEWLEKEDYFIDRLSKYNINTSVDVEKLRPRIHIAVHKNIFALNLAEKRDKITELAIEKVLANV